MHFPKTEEIEFYDLKEDPAQDVNQAKNPAYRSAIMQTEVVLEEIMREVDIKPAELPLGQ